MWARLNAPYIRGRTITEGLKLNGLGADALTAALYAMCVQDFSSMWQAPNETRTRLDELLEDLGSMALGEDRPTFEEREGLREMLNVMDDGQPIVTRNRDG